MSSSFASHSVPVTPTGPDAPKPAEATKPSGINPIAEIPNPPTQETPSKKERPADIPEKFWDAEKGEVRTTELLKSYTELEKARTAPPKEGEAKTPEQLKAEADAAAKAKEEADKATAPVPTQFVKFNDEFAKDGKLSDESYKELADKHGLSKEYVDLYIAGLQAKQAEYSKTVAEAAGGEEQLSKLFDWAGKTLSNDELEAANKALGSGDKAAAALAVRGLAARYQAENGKEPSLISGDAPEAGVKPFNSTAEVVSAMSDPRYKTDPAYRREIEKRLDISSVI